MKLIQTLLIASAMAAMSTVDLEANNPYDGQYEVNHMDPRRSTWEHKEGEVIVKLKANNGAAPAKIRAAKGKVSSSSSALENMLRENGLQEAEQLMTLGRDSLHSKSTGHQWQTGCRLRSLRSLRPAL